MSIVDYLHLIAGTIFRHGNKKHRLEDPGVEKATLRGGEERDAVSNRDRKPIYPLEPRIPPSLIYRRTLSGFWIEDRGAQTSSLGVSSPFLARIVRRRRMGQWRRVPLDLARPESFAL